MKNEKINQTEVTTPKITKSKAKKLYNELIQKNTDALEREKSNDIKKYNILNVLNNIGSIFTGTCSHYIDVYLKEISQRE